MSDSSAEGGSRYLRFTDYLFTQIPLRGGGEGGSVIYPVVLRVRPATPTRDRLLRRMSPIGSIPVLVAIRGPPLLSGFFLWGTACVPFGVSLVRPSAGIGFQSLVVALRFFFPSAGSLTLRHSRRGSSFFFSAALSPSVLRFASGRRESRPPVFRLVGYSSFGPAPSCPAVILVAVLPGAGASSPSPLSPTVVGSPRVLLESASPCLLARYPLAP